MDDSPMPMAPGDWNEASEGRLSTTRQVSVSCVARWLRKPGAFLEWIVNRVKYTGRRRNLSNGAPLNGDVDLAENEALTAHDTPTTTHPLDSAHPLLKLPQEVRDIIYVHVFQDAISTATLNGILKQYRMLPPALHEVCRQLRRELRNHSCRKFQDYLHHPDRTSDFWTNPHRIDWRDQDTPIHWTVAFPTPASNRHKRVLYHARVKPYNCEVQVYSQNSDTEQQWNLLAKIWFGDHVSTVCDYCGDSSCIDTYEQLAHHALLALQRITAPWSRVMILDRNVKVGVLRIVRELSHLALETPSMTRQLVEDGTRVHTISHRLDTADLDRNVLELYDLRSGRRGLRRLDSMHS